MIDETDKSNWLSCPYDETHTVYIQTDYGRAVQFVCADCDTETDMDYDKHWSIYDLKQYNCEYE